MPKYPIIGGGELTNNTNLSFGMTRYIPHYAWCRPASTETYGERLARDAYTLSNLYIRVGINTINAGNSLLTSRKNSAPGAQTCTIPFGVTGQFEDAVNTDALVSGDVFTTRMVASGANGWIAFTAVSFVMDGPSTIIGGSQTGSITPAAQNKYSHISGCVFSETAEVYSPVIVRQAMTTANLRVRILTNTSDVQSGFKTRKNGGDGVQVVNIPAGTTGAFEDAVNTDNYVAGDTISFRLQGTGMTVGSVLGYTAHVRVTTGHQIQGAGSGGRPQSVYFALTGDISTAIAAEADAQITLRTATKISNGFARVSTNAENSIRKVQMRKNGGDGNLVITVPALTTGTFEDLVNSDSCLAGDLMDVFVNSTVTDPYYNSFTFQYEPPVGGAAAPQNQIARALVGAGMI